MVLKSVLGCGLAVTYLVACSSSSSSSSPGNEAGTSTGGGSSAGGTTSGGGAGGSNGGKGGGGAGGKTVTDAGPDGGGTTTVSGDVVDFSGADATKNFDATKYPALAGVEVCVFEQSSVPCVTTDSAGHYSIAVPVGATIYLSYKKTTYTPTLYGVTPAAGTTIAAPAILFPSAAYTNSFGTQGGAPPDATKGTILFGATWLGPSSTPFHEMFGATELYYLGGFSTTISPAATVGPVYTSTAWAPDPTLDKSSAAGWGFFAAPPGDYTLTFTRPGFTCGTTKTKVVAGYSTTYVGTLCSRNGDGGVPDAGAADATITDAAPHPG